jgi:membrane fusion protein, heavy metal efflux system
MIFLSYKYQNTHTANSIKIMGRFILPVAFLLMLASCGQPDAPADNMQETGLSGKQKVSLTPEQIELAGIEFGFIEKKLLSGDVDARGKLILPQDGKASVGPVIRGVVHSIEVQQGQSVVKGQVLAYLTHPDYIRIQEQYLSTINSLVFLENDFKRQERLYAENVSSEKKFLQVKTDYLGAKAKKKSLKLMIEQIGIDPVKIEGGKIFSKIPVKTPITGMVNAISVNLGKNVNEGEELFEITCRNKLFLDLSVFEKDIQKIEKGQRVTFTLSNIDTVIFEAGVISIGGSVQQAGRVVKVLAEFENSGQNLFPGMFVASLIHTREALYDALPESALMDYGTGKPYVYFTTSPADSPDIEFETAAVATGYEEDGYVQVTLLTPLPANSRIVTKGGYYVQAGEAE